VQKNQGIAGIKKKTTAANTYKNISGRRRLDALQWREIQTEVKYEKEQLRATE
jgi:hypothetical protein